MISNLPHAPATKRNRGPIWDLLSNILPLKGAILEVASGTGEHLAWMAPQRVELSWQPSDQSKERCSVIDSYNIEHSNVLPAITLDVNDPVWPILKYNAILCINMIHISPWESTIALFHHAQNHLIQNGLLYLYGPFNQNGKYTSHGNARFDQSLRRENESWGIRDLEQVISLAKENGFHQHKVISMPANNLSVSFRCTK